MCWVNFKNMRTFTWPLKVMLNVYQRINSGNILQCPSSQQNLKHFPTLMKLKCINIHCHYLRCTCAFEVHEFGKNQDFEKRKDKHIAKGTEKISRGCQGKGLISCILLIFEYQKTGQMKKLQNFLLFQNLSVYIYMNDKPVCVCVTQ